ncbi:MAG: redoxin domain-containing protein [Bacteroidota bacterium]|nr:redoxin domain-containing protein [Bacteroidota bacterium]
MKCFFFLIAILLSTTIFAQQDNTLPPYKRYPTVPGLQLLSLDSTVYTKENLPKKRQLLVMLFSPDCDHCQHEAEELVANKEGFRDKQILMVSTYPLFRVKEFAVKYGLDQMENVTLTKDPFYNLIAFYAVRSLPHLALYNRKGDLIQTYSGKVGIDKVLTMFAENK